MTITTDTLRPGTRVCLPDGTEATIRTLEIGGATYAIDVHGTILRGWPREQLTVAASGPAASRCSTTVYAVVLPPPDGRPILRQPNLIRYGWGLWPDGFPGTVVGVIVDSGTGITESGIRAALTVTVLDSVFASDVQGAAVDHALCELDRMDRIVANIDICPGCGKPAHESETTDDGYHEACIAARHDWPRDTVGLEIGLSEEASRRGMTIFELAQERRRISDSPIRCGQLDQIIEMHTAAWRGGES